MSLDLFAALIKFSFSVEHCLHIREYKITDLDFFFFSLKIHYYFRREKNSNSMTGFKSAFWLSLKTKEKAITSHKTPLIDDSQLFLLKWPAPRKTCLVEFHLRDQLNSFNKTKCF